MKIKHKKRSNHHTIVRNIAKRLKIEARWRLNKCEIGIRLNSSHLSQVDYYSDKMLSAFKEQVKFERSIKDGIHQYLQMSDKRLYQQWRCGDWVEVLYR